MSSNESYIACHSEATSGHYGVTKTLDRIRERFYWKGIVADVRGLVNICYHRISNFIFVLLRYKT